MGEKYELKRKLRKQLETNGYTKQRYRDSEEDIKRMKKVK